MKKSLSRLVLVGFIVTVCFLVFGISQRQQVTVLAAPETVLSLEPSDITASLGQSFTLDAVVDTGTNEVVAVEMHFTFDPSVLEATSLTAGEDLTNVYEGPVIDNQAGTAFIIVGDIANLLQGRGSVASIMFRVIGPSDEVERIRFSSGTRASATGEDLWGTDVLVQRRGATVMVTGTGEEDGSDDEGGQGEETTAAAVSGCWEPCTVDGVATLGCLECVFEKIVSVALKLAGIALFIMLIVGGFQYTTAGGNPKAVERAKKTLTYAVVGLLLVITAWLILLAISQITGLNLTVFRVVI